VDFHRLAPGPHTIDRIERDPGRSAHIALITNNATSRKSYILAADGLRAGDTVQSYRDGIPDDLMAAMGGRIDPGMLAARTTTKGNCLPMHMIPIGSVVFGVGSKEKGGAVFCRAAGTYATVVAREPATKSVIVKMQSGEVRRVSKFAAATMGVASNMTWQHRQLGKAGRSRNLGIRPTVRGVAMNACESSVSIFYILDIHSFVFFLSRQQLWCGKGVSRAMWYYQCSTSASQYACSTEQTLVTLLKSPSPVPLHLAFPVSREPTHLRHPIHRNRIWVGTHGSGQSYSPKRPHKIEKA